VPLYRAELLHQRYALAKPKIHDVNQVLYLPLDKDDGSYARDRSGCNNHGVIYGAVRAAGKIGGALSFDGVDDRVDCGYGLTGLGRGEFTLMAWANCLGAGTGSYPGVLNREFSGNILICRRADLNKWHFFIHAEGQSSTAIDSNDVITWGVWYHLAMTRDSAGNFKAYVNGVQQGVTRYYPYDLSGVGRKFWVGRYSSSYFQGLIDEVRVYRRALSQAEIQRLMNVRGI
jgi:hypothetical protein